MFPGIDWRTMQTSEIWTAAYLHGNWKRVEHHKIPFHTKHARDGHQRAFAFSVNLLFSSCPLPLPLTSPARRQDDLQRGITPPPEISATTIAPTSS